MDQSDKNKKKEHKELDRDWAHVKRSWLDSVCTVFGCLVFVCSLYVRIMRMCRVVSSGALHTYDLCVHCNTTKQVYC